MNNINIVYISDEGYRQHTTTSIRSITKNKGAEFNYNISVFTYNVSESYKNELNELSTENIHVSIIDVENDMKYVESIFGIINTVDTVVTKTAMLKFIIPDILKDMDKVLYLDGDTLIQSDLSALFGVDISEYYLAAVPDMGEKFDERRNYLARINAPGEFYFNSGVMLLNLKKMREDNVNQSLIEYRKNGCNHYMDQDALNYVMGEKALKLPYKYNFLSSSLLEYELEDLLKIYFEEQMYEDVETLLDDMDIIHTAGALKPWVYELTWVSKVYFKYYQGEMPKLKCPIVPYQRKLHTSAKSSNKSVSLHNSAVGKKKIGELESASRKITRLIAELKDELKTSGVKKETSKSDNSLRKDWIFPYALIPKDSKIVIWGSGIIGKKMLEQLNYTQYCTVVSWVDSKWEQLGEEITDPKKILDEEFDYILLAIANYDVQKEITDDLIEWGINSTKIIGIP